MYAILCAHKGVTDAVSLSSCVAVTVSLPMLLNSVVETKIRLNIYMNQVCVSEFTKKRERMAKKTHISQ